MLLEHATTQWIADAAILLDSADSAASAASAAIPAADAAQNGGWFDTCALPVPVLCVSGSGTVMPERCPPPVEHWWSELAGGPDAGSW